MAIQCEICDSMNLLKQDGVFVCQDCGAKYTTEEIKKMVSVKAEKTFEQNFATPVEKKAPVITTPVLPPEQEISQILQWAEEAFQAGNTSACRKYMNDVKWKSPYNPEYFKRCCKYGIFLGEGELQDMVTKGPAEEKEARLELAYKLLEEQGKGISFGDPSHALEVVGEAERLLNTDIPRWRMNDLWDENRMLEIYFKSVIRQLNNYQLPDPDSPDGLYARINWQIVRGIEKMDVYFEKMSVLLPQEYKIEMFTAFCKASEVVLKGRFYTDDSKSWHNIRIDESHYFYGSDLKVAKKVLAKYKKIVEKYKEEQEAARLAELERKAREALAAKQAENEAYWAEHFEEYSQLKSEKTLLEAKIRKLQNEHQADPQKKAMEEARKDIIKYNYELQSCGFFQGKRKKELAEWIAVLQKKEQECAAAYDKNTANYEESLQDLQNQLAEVNKKLNRE
ncbi:MAG: hypothetical protein E7385_08015 [Ruminococcaceae bacterium]|nr:hypothetical protein [Oscillospiraceae bacterium]